MSLITEKIWDASFLQSWQTRYALHNSHLQDFQSNSFAAFLSEGFPSAKHENWRYSASAVQEIKELSFKKAKLLSSSDLSKNQLSKETWHFVFVNGYFQSHLSTIEDLPSGVIFLDLSTALQTIPECQKLILEKTDNQFFSQLNNALMCNGFLLYIPENMTLKKPIYFQHYQTQEADMTMNHPRHLIIANSSSRALIFEEYLGFSGITYFNNVVTQIVLKDSANLEYCKLQRENNSSFHISETLVQQEANSSFMHYQLSFGAKVNRETLKLNFQGENSSCCLSGFYLANQGRHLDYASCIDHLCSNCKSEQFYCGVVEDESQSIFNGKVIVRENTKNSIAKQLNQNLLMSPLAKANTKPELEIYTDDVQCSHAATIGQLDEDAIFYFRSRGIDEDQAKKILLDAFRMKILSRLPDLIQNYILDVIP